MLQFFECFLVLGHLSAGYGGPEIAWSWPTKILVLGLEVSSCPKTLKPGGLKSTSMWLTGEGLGFRV